MLKSVLMSVFLLLLCAACSTRRLIPLPAGGPEALPVDVLIKAGAGKKVVDPEAITALAVAAEFFRLSERVGSRIWPGWTAEKMPVAVELGSGRGLLINHDDVPPGMEFADQQILDKPVFCGLFPAGLVLGEAAKFRGRATAALSFDRSGRGKAGRVLSVEESVSEFFEASCFCLMDTLFKRSFELHDIARGQAISQVYCTRRPEFRRSEAAFLLEALESRDETACRRAVTCFLVVRKARRTRALFRSTAAEQAMEDRCGAALYTGIRALEIARDEEMASRKPVAAAGASTVAFEGYGEAALQKQARLVSALSCFRYEDTLCCREWFSLTGMILAFLLDRLSPGWKDRFIAEETPMECLLEDCVFVNERLQAVDADRPR